MIQRRFCNENSIMNEMKINNSNDISELKGDLKEMKNVISKLSNEDWYNKK